MPSHKGIITINLGDMYGILGFLYNNPSDITDLLGNKLLIQPLVVEGMINIDGNPVRIFNHLGQIAMDADNILEDIGWIINNKINSFNHQGLD